MITTRLHGGMGNQLFQYAAGRALAARLGTELCVDDRLLTRPAHKPCQKHFNWRTVPAERQPPLKSQNLLAYGLWRLLGRNPRFRRERGLGFNPRFLSWGDATYLHGYWQSERYFAPIAESLREELTILTPPSAQNQDLAASIRAVPSVSLHVRRGDYLAIAAHNVCTEAYYTAALEAVVKRAQIAPHVFVFSDDPDWAKTHLPLTYPKTVVDFNDATSDYEDLRLMSLCDHNVIANSSFSWWGAWLNSNPAKVVAAPATWFGSRKLRNPDILPVRWIAVKTR